MSEPTAVARSAARRPQPLRFLLGAIKRGYALALIAVVLWLSGRAIWYLLAALIWPAPPPPQIVALPLRADLAMVTSGPEAYAGVQAVGHPRAPLGHYHQVGTWFLPDTHNDCTSAGCHPPLPHGRNRADRAFLNMHATSLHCGVCHLQSEQRPLRLTWYDLASGAPSGPPALLQAYARLEDARAAGTLTPEGQRELVRLLEAAAKAAGEPPALREIVQHVAAVRASNEQMPRLLESAEEVVAGLFHGQYGAKLALADAGNQPILGPRGAADAIREYRAQGATLDPQQRTDLLARVHPQRRPTTLRCTECHTPTGGLVDLRAVGYPDARWRQLQQPQVMQAIQDITDGREFHMPGFLGAPAASQPAQGRP